MKLIACIGVFSFLDFFPVASLPHVIFNFTYITIVTVEMWL